MAKDTLDSLPRNPLFSGWTKDMDVELVRQRRYQRGWGKIIKVLGRDLAICQERYGLVNPYFWDAEADEKLLKGAYRDVLQKGISLSLCHDRRKLLQDGKAITTSDVIGPPRNTITTIGDKPPTIPLPRVTTIGDKPPTIPLPRVTTIRDKPPTIPLPRVLGIGKPLPLPTIFFVRSEKNVVGPDPVCAPGPIGATGPPTTAEELFGRGRGP